MARKRHSEEKTPETKTEPKARELARKIKGLRRPSERLSEFISFFYVRDPFGRGNLCLLAFVAPSAWFFILDSRIRVRFGPHVPPRGEGEGSRGIKRAIRAGTGVEIHLPDGVRIDIFITRQMYMIYIDVVR